MIKQITKDTLVTTDICIVGAGTCGLFLANLLVRSGLQVTLIEAGSSEPKSAMEVGATSEHVSREYLGDSLGRSFGIGGTSALWGGQLIKLRESDVVARPHIDAPAWPLDYSELERGYSEAKRILGMDLESIEHEEYPELAAITAEFELRCADWIPFGQRNFANFFNRIVERENNPVIYAQCTVADFEFKAESAQTRISKVIAQSIQGHRLEIEAGRVVICAGALESTRILLAIDDTTGIIKGTGASLGRYFSDHLSVTAGEVECSDLWAFIAATSAGFLRGKMKSPRLELTEEMQKEHKLPSTFAHFGFHTDGNTGFDSIRELLRGRQRRDAGWFHEGPFTRRQFKDLVWIAYWRLLRGKMAIPEGARVILQVDSEQLPDYNNRLYLSDQRDTLNRRKLVIDWRVTEQDINALSDTSDRIIQAWNSSRLGKVARVSPRAPDGVLANLYDVYHPTGSIRMGSNEQSSVLDANLKVWRFTNLFTLSTAVFPSAGSANPGLTHLALAVLLAEYLDATK
jgi:hypothetical protein